jgi:hypothetical protein
MIVDLARSSGSLATLAAIRRASSLVSSLVADRRPGSSSEYTAASFWPAAVLHDEAGVAEFFNCP